MFCKCFILHVTNLQNICKNVSEVVTCKTKHVYNIPRHSRGKSTALKHFCKCFILHVTKSSDVSSIQK